LPTPQEIQTRLERILPTVQKPGRYTGGELNQVVKDWASVSTHVALAFPDIYDLGMSNLALAILYDLLNQRADVLAERVYAPWTDMEAALRAANLPLYSLETKHPLSDFDIIGFSLPYETLYTNALNMLDLAGIPLLSAKRTAEHPLVIAGGHATFNPEPMHPFIDAFVIGEGEEVIHEIVDTYQEWRATRGSRPDLLRALSRVWGVYVPSLYVGHYHPDGTFSHIEKLDPDAPLPIVKRIVPKLPPPPTRLIVPYVDTTHNRIPIEITRGCPFACRYCQTSYLFGTRVRHRSIEMIGELAAEMAGRGLAGIRVVTPNALAYGSPDGRTVELDGVEELRARLRATVGRRGRIFFGSFPSEVRPDHLDDRAATLLQRYVDNDNLVIGAQSGSDRMLVHCRRGHTTADVIRAVTAARKAGFLPLVDFIFGLPGETREDRAATIRLMDRLVGLGARVHAHTFMPLPQTPFAAAPPGRVEPELRRHAERLVARGSLFGTWQRQEEEARRLAAATARRSHVKNMLYTGA